MPKELLTAGRKTTLLTYKSEESVLSSYLRKLDVPLEVANNNELEDAFRRKAAKLITIRDNSILSRLSLSQSGQIAGMSNSNHFRTVFNALKNLRGRQLKDVPAENILITCAKDGCYKNADKTTAGPLCFRFQAVPRYKLSSQGHPRDQQLRTLLPLRLPLRSAHEPLCGSLVRGQLKSI